MVGQQSSNQKITAVKANSSRSTVLKNPVQTQHWRCHRSTSRHSIYSIVINVGAVLQVLQK